MSTTTLKLATIAYLCLAKDQSEKLSWADVSKSMIFFEENKNRPAFAELLRELCEGDPDFNDLDADDKPAHCSAKLFKLTQLFQGRLRNLANVNGQIVVQKSNVKGVEFENSNKNGAGKQAYLNVRIDSESARDPSVWQDLSGKIKSEFTQSGGSICPDLLLGVVWDGDEQTLRLKNIDALETWCLNLGQSKKSKTKDNVARVKLHLQGIIANLLANTESQANDPEAVAIEQAGAAPTSTLTQPTFKILHGPPGTGKTTLAKRFCVENNWMPYIIQVHPSYSYEEFIEGLKPITFANGELRYDIVDGPVKILAQRIARTPLQVLCSVTRSGDKCYLRLPLGFAERYSMNRVRLYSEGAVSHNYYELTADTVTIDVAEIPPWALSLKEAIAKLDSDTAVKEAFQKMSLINDLSIQSEVCLVLDEINRGNVSQLLGELLFSISETESENPESVKLQYSQQPFSWPKGLHIIGTMNTADLSTDRMDQAVKRRFTFEYVEPQPTIFENGEDHFGFLKAFNEKSIIRDAAFQKVQSLNELAIRFAHSKRTFTQLLENMNELLIGNAKKYGLINIADKIIGHSFFIKMARKVCIHFEGPIALELAFYGEFKEMLLGEVLPALQSVFNYDHESVNSYFSDLSGKKIASLPGTEKWADEVMIHLLWSGEATKAPTISLENYRQQQWTKRPA